MAGGIINIELAKIALDRVDGNTFEQFFHAFYSAATGEDVIPLGGHKDGGADAFEPSRLWEVSSRPTSFFQASIEEDVESKIRRTLTRLKKFGREVRFLTYFSSQTIRLSDRLEDSLTSELDVVVRFRDQGFIISHLNDNAQTQAAYWTYLHKQTDFLRTVGGIDVMPTVSDGDSVPVYVFLRQEIDRQSGKVGLLQALADGLILWALEGTDPDAGIFLAEAEIKKKIRDALPAAESILRDVIPYRLKVLSKEFRGSERLVRWYKREGKYCLSHEIRKYVEADNLADQSLHDTVVSQLRSTATSIQEPKLNQNEVERVAYVALKAIQSAYETEGLELASFIKNPLGDLPQPKTLSEHADALLREQGVGGKNFQKVKEACLEVMRRVFYESTPEQRNYFARLSNTYALLFALKTEPRIAEYFQKMQADFNLLVGSDIIIRALSEHYLHRPDQMITNALLLIRAAGGKLFLTEPVFDEVWTHINAANSEFNNHYRMIESRIGKDIARQSNRILIRAYLYARLFTPAGINPPNSWNEFIDQFCDSSELHTQHGSEQLRKYVLAKFGMEYIEREDVCPKCDLHEVEALAAKLEREKNISILAQNDALMTYAVYARRSLNRERAFHNQFGYKTWWLTGERRVLKHTEILVKRYGAGYMIRPEFLLNFISLAPSAAQIRKTYQEIFPSKLGIQLARRVDSATLSSVLDKAKSAFNLDPARRDAAIADLSDTLKADFLKSYEGQAELSVEHAIAKPVVGKQQTVQAQQKTRSKKLTKK